jgi:copper chaperone CopZ
MCKRTIEGSLNDQEGVNSSIWDKETKIIEINYDPSIISLDEIKMKITAVGYDTEDKRATEGAYKGLPGCCQYERPEKIRN